MASRHEENFTASGKYDRKLEKGMEVISFGFSKFMFPFLTPFCVDHNFSGK